MTRFTNERLLRTPDHQAKNHEITIHPDASWGEIFGDDIAVAALIDRLLHHFHIINIRGNNFRMRQHIELWK